MKARLAALCAAAMLVAGACANSTDEANTVATPPAGATASPGSVSVKLGNVPKTVEGNVVTMPVTVSGIQIVKPDGNTSGQTGHFHVFIDKEAPPVGTVIPRERGIVHSFDNPIKLYGLKAGMHTFHLVLGDGTHKRITDVHEMVSVDVKGPSVTATAPATVDSGSDVKVELTSEGIDIVKADGDSSGETGHYHVLVDPASPPKAGETIPAAVENKIVHTNESSAMISGLTKGEHVIWVVVGDGTHKALDPPVMDRLTVTVS